MAIAVHKSGHLDEALRASQIVDALIYSGLEIPGAEDPADEKQRSLALGRCLSKLFRGKDTLKLGEFIVHHDQRQERNSNYDNKTVHYYRFKIAEQRAETQDPT